MTNFEGLIRGALAAKGASLPEARNAIYQSSRNALQRLIDTNRSMTVENALKEQRALEDAIERIEAEYRPPEPAPVRTVPEPQDPLHELKQILMEDSDDFRNAQAAQNVQAVEPAAYSQVPETLPVEAAELQPVQSQHSSEVQHQPLEEADIRIDEPQPVTTANNPEPNVDGHVDAMLAPSVETAARDEVTTQAYVETDNLPLEFAQRRKSQKRFAWIVVTLAVLGLLAWLGYYLYVGITDGTLFGLNDKPFNNQNATTEQNAASNYITVLEPGDLSSLITAGRGQAELINELNLEMIRLVSVRGDNRSQAAEPILLRLKPGVMEQISGKNVTFEIYGKSGTSSPAQFTVKCQFGELGNCGRKRFRVGLQPEASIFAFEMGTVRQSNQDAFIAISTDITEGASVTGRGDAIDIVYARLRAN